MSSHHVHNHAFAANATLIPAHMAKPHVRIVQFCSSDPSSTYDFQSPIRIFRIMQKLSSSMPENRKPLAKTSPFKAGSARAAIPRAASASRTQRRLLPGQHPGRRRREAAELRSRDQAALGRLQRHGRGRGEGFAGKGQATEVHAAEVMVHGWADPEAYPLQKKRHSFRSSANRPSAAADEHVRRDRPRAQLRSAASIHDFFQERGFLYVHTPIITASDCEGAGEMFQVTTLDLAKLPRSRRASVDYAQDFFGKPAYLTVSGQLEGEIFACVAGQGLHVRPDVPRGELEHVAAPGRVLDGRAGDGVLRAGRQHGPGRGVPRSASSATCWRSAPRTCSSSTSASTRRCSTRSKNIVDSEFVRLPYTEAVEILREVGHRRSSSRSRGARDLQVEHERYLTEKHFKQPVILYDYPRTIKPFYMRVNDDGKTVRAMDVLVPGVGEIIGGSQREERLDVLEAADAGAGPRTRTTTGGTSTCAATAPCRTPASAWAWSGCVQFITGMANIRDVIRSRARRGTRSSEDWQSAS